MSREYLIDKNNNPLIIEVGAPLSSKYINNIFDIVDNTLRDFEEDIVGPWKGQWEIGVIYQRNDVVIGPDGSLYIALINHESSSDIEPRNSVEYWELLVDSPPRWRGDWTSTEEYYENDVVRGEDRKLYIAKMYSLSENPKDDNGFYWEIFVQSPLLWQGDWNSTIRYYENDVVKDADDGIYVAKSENIGSPPKEDTEEEHWKLFVRPSVIWRGEWESDVLYYKNNIVKAHDNNIYIAISENINQDPPHSSEWDIFLYGADSGSNAVQIQGFPVTQKDPEDSEGFIYREEQQKYQLEKIYNQKEVDIKAQEEAFLHSIVYGTNAKDYLFSHNNLDDLEDHEKARENLDIYSRNQIRSEIAYAESKMESYTDETISEHEDKTVDDGVHGIGGASGTFTSSDGKTITVENGLITDITDS